jgi:hypothetical protein
VVTAFTVGRPPNRLLRSSLAGLCLIVCLIELHALLVGYPWGVDVVIPLNAASRWVSGGQPYLASSFQAGPGYGAPFLYPPFVLPFVAILTAVPQDLVVGVWFVISATAAIFACRRLAIPWLLMPALLVWPPFAEGLLGGNVQIVIFAAFVALFWRRPEPDSRQPAFEPIEHDPVDRDRPAQVDGLLATAVGILKPTQIQSWLYVGRRRWVAAAFGAIAVAGLALATLPIVGVQLWLDWFVQLGRASDPAWILAGDGIARSLPAWAGDLIFFGSLAAVWLVPSRHAGAWIGLLTLIGSSSLRVFGLLFALPAMLLVRREIGLVAGLLMATYTFEGWWLGVFLVSGSVLLGRRVAWLLEPRGRLAT